MRLLLDTHVWFWSVLEPWKLNSAVHQELAAQDNELWLSPVSVWELFLLVKKKKLEVQGDFGERVRQSIVQLDLHGAPLTEEVALDMPFIAMAHKDPGDYFLVATARTYELTLITNDERILESAERNRLRVLDNR